MGSLCCMAVGGDLLADLVGGDRPIGVDLGAA